MSDYLALYDYGMAADRVLILDHLTGRRFTRKPEYKGKDENGNIVHWHYSDCILDIRRYEKDGIECYRIFNMVGI